MHGAGQGTGDPQNLTLRAGDDLQVHPVAAVFAGVERPVSGDPVDGMRVPSITTNACPAFFAAASARGSFGARAASRVMVSRAYRQAVAVPTAKPAAQPA